MEIHLAGSRPTRRAPSDYFTGSVLQDPIIATEAPARLNSARVSFEPGARTAWHTHPLGQTLYVTQGVGWVQMRGQPKREIRPGDTVWIPPAVIHWHGATTTSAMTHVAIHEALDGKNVDWMEKVTEGEYGG
jgi:quercetin dioxygenase-like cupin family protein